MLRLRHIVQSALCCLLCLTVCAAPALAANDQYTDGFLYWENGAVINWSAGSYSLDILSGYFPASFSTEDFISGSVSSGRYFSLDGNVLPRPAGTYSFSLTTPSQFYVEVLYSVPAPLSVLTVEKYDYIDPTVKCQFGVASSVQSNTAFTSKVASADISKVVDGELIPLVSSGNDSFVIPDTTFDVKRYWGYRFYFNPLSLSKSGSDDLFARLYWFEKDVNYTFSDPNYIEGIYGEVTVNTGVLQEINGTLTEIKTSTTTIQNDVSEIKDGLQDSNSSIWGAFKDSVSGLFVPSADELNTAIGGFNQLASEKLGGAYQAVGIVNNGVQSVTNKFKNPGDSPGVEFPGISVPLGGDVGTVTLAASQTVTIPEQITSVLYPVAGVIIPIVCVIWTIRQCTDMVECFMSGMSYAEFLHRNSDEEDDEI